MLICLSLALIAGLLMSRAAKAVRLPAVTAYLLTGLLLGPFFLGRLGLSRFGFGFGSLAAVEGYGILTQVALGFIAFVIGNEFRLSALKHMGRRAVTVGIAQAVITTALVDIALVALHFARPDFISLASAITLGSIAAATAPAATLMVVKQYKADGPLTKLLLMVDEAVHLEHVALTDDAVFADAVFQHFHSSSLPPNFPVTKRSIFHISIPDTFPVGKAFSAQI